MILGRHDVKFVCDGLEPTLLSTRETWMVTQAHITPATRFCKFEYDHQLSVFVPLSASFLRTRKATLPGHILKSGTMVIASACAIPVSSALIHALFCVIPGVHCANPSNFERITEGDRRSETLQVAPTPVTGSTFLTPVRKRKGKADTSPSASRSSTPLPVEQSPMERTPQSLATRVYSSSFHGVSMHKSSQRWHAQVRYHGKRISLGYYDDELEAAQAYDKVCGIFRKRVGLPLYRIRTCSHRLRADLGWTCQS